MEQETNVNQFNAVPEQQGQQATQADVAFNAMFGATPQHSQPQPSEQGQSQGSQPSSAENGIIDLSDPSLMTATVEYDPEADANAYKPLPDGDWICTIELDESGDKGGIYAKRTDKSGTYLVAAIKAKVADPSAGVFDGFPIDTNWLTSIYQDRTGTSGLVHLLNCLGKPAPRGMSLGELGKFAEQVLKSGLKCKVRTRWEARSQEAQELYEAGDTRDGRKNGVLKTGMKSFPQNDKNEYIPFVACPVTGEDKPARAKTVTYLALK